MEARNYAPNAQHNMILPPDAQVVTGVLGNAVYLPAGCGIIEMDGTLSALGISLWRTWDGVIETDSFRGIFSFRNFKAYFDCASGKLCITLPAGNITTDIDDDTELTHWVFNFSKAGGMNIYKNAVKIYEDQVVNEVVDLADGFTLGGGKTHAIFDEIYIHTELLKEEEVNGLFYLIRNGMPQQQIQEIAQSSTAKYLGVTETVPPNRGVFIVKGEHLGIVYANTGDWVLMSKTVGGWKAGVCYRWTGVVWINLVPEHNYEAQYQACLSHICEIPELVQDTGHYGALFAKLLVAQKALIDSLIVKQLKIDADLSNDKNFEAYFDENHGLEVKNNGKTILRVPPQGDSIFTGKVNVGAVQLLDYGIYIKDGEISIENKGWKGALRPCSDGVEFVILSEEDGAMTKKQMQTVIRNGVLSLFVLGSITCCDGFFGSNKDLQNGFVKKGNIPLEGLNILLYSNNVFTGIGYNDKEENMSIISTDKGKHWTHKNIPAIHPVYNFSPYFNAINNETSIAMLRRGGVAVSIDNGNSWQVKRRPVNGLASFDFHDSVIMAAVYYQGGYGLQLLLSKDNGISWSAISIKGGSFGVAHVLYKNGVWHVTYGQYYCQLDDSGNMLKEREFEYYGKFMCVNASTLAVFTNVNRFFISHDNGTTWEETKLPYYAGALDFACSDTVFVFLDEKGLFFSTDNGTTWQRRNFTTNSYDGGRVCFNGTTWLLSYLRKTSPTSYTQTFFTSTNGIDWEEKPELSFLGVAVDVTCGEGICVVNTMKGKTYISTDNYNTWREKNIPYFFGRRPKLMRAKNNIFMFDAYQRSLAVTTYDFNSPSYILYGSAVLTDIAFSGSRIIGISPTLKPGSEGAQLYEKGIFISTDNGNTWIEKLCGEPGLIKIACSDTTFVSLKEKDTCIYISHDDGATWVKKKLCDEKIFSVSYCHDSFFVSADTKYPSREGAFFISNDDGISWIKKTVGKTAPYQFIHYDSTFVCHNGKSVFISNDNGHTWIKKFSVEDSFHEYIGSIAGDSSTLLAVVYNSSGDKITQILYASTDTVVWEPVP